MSGASNFGQDHGLIHEVVITGRKAGWTSSEWARLAHDENLMVQIQDVMLGRASIQGPSKVIELGAEPKNIPDQLQLLVHQSTPQTWTWDEREVELKLAPGQSQGLFTGEKVAEFIQASGWKCANIAVEQFLLENQAFIPEKWRSCKIFFWDSVLSNGFAEWIPYMEWHGDMWRGSFRKATERWMVQEPALIFST